MRRKLRTGRKVKIANNKKDFKSFNRDLKGNNSLFLDNSQRLIYNFK